MTDFLFSSTWITIIIINYFLVVLAIGTLIFKPINPVKTLSYIIVLIVFHIFGLIIYYFFGQDYRKNKIFNRKNILNNNLVKRVNDQIALNKKELKYVEKHFLDDKIRLVHLLQQCDNTPLTLNNAVEVLENGEQKFEKLFKDLEAATKHIHAEYYIIKDDVIGTKFLNLLCEKAKQGLKVKLSIDDVGSSLSSKMKKKLKSSGVEFYAFMPVLFPKFTGRMNYRNHRKIIVIDGEIAYLGGINVSDLYVNTENSKDFWRDTHLRILGEAVYTVQLQFLTNWNFVSQQEVSIQKDYFAPITIDAVVPTQIAASGPDTDWANIMEAIFYAITTAQDYIYITTPYFIPNAQIITALQVASKSGVDVKLLIPNKSDSWIAEHATNSYLDKLLEADITIYKYTKGFIHAKTIIVDDIFSTVGTSNMDNRSFNINFEINALIYHKETGVILKDMFLNDILTAEVLDKASWRNRSKSEKLKEAYSRLWAPLL